MSTAPLLVVDELRHSYRRRVRALDGLSLATTSHRTVLLGPNGAGKSTFLAAVAGLLEPRGSIRLPGDSSPTSAARRHRRVGLMSQEIHPIPGLTVLEQVSCAGWLGGLSPKSARRRASQLLEQVQLQDKAGARSSELSGGQLRRVGLAQALVHEPCLLLLDEPTAGMDPAQRARFRHLVQSLPQELPVVVSTHLVDDIDVVYQEVVVMDAGRLVFQGTPAEFAGDTSAEDAYLALLGGGER